MEEEGADGYRHGASSIFFNLLSFVLLLLMATSLLLEIVIPSLATTFSQNFKPSLVKRSWDWINLVLVLFALAFGFLSRIRNEDRDYNGYRRTGSTTSSEGAPKSYPSSPHQPWFDFPDQTVGWLGRSGNSSSDPDLRELPVAGRDPWRFSDDTHLNPPLTPPSQPRVTASAPPAAKKTTKRKYRSLGQERKKMGRKVHSNSEPRTIVAEEPEEPSPATPVMPSLQEMEQRNNRSNRKRSSRNATKDFWDFFYSEKKERRQRRRSVDNLDAPLHHPQAEMASPLLPPMPPPLTATRASILTTSKAPVTSQKPPTPERLQNFYSIDDSSSGGEWIPPQPPSAARASRPTTSKPPVTSQKPPMPEKIYNFNNMDDNSSGSEWIEWISPLPPSVARASRHTTSKEPVNSQKPPMPAKLHNFNIIDDSSSVGEWTPPPAARASRPTTSKAPVTSQKPPMPANILNFKNMNDSSSGSESSTGQIPLPPPLPPFRIPSLKYVVEGDYARLLSTDSSRSGSSDPDEVESPSSDDVMPSPPLFCPSPDVDTKADIYIAKVKAGMKLEKLNSLNQKQGLRMSNLGPNPGSSSQN